MIALLAASSFAYAIFAPCKTSERHTERACATATDTEDRWVECVTRRVDSRQFDDARRLANLGLHTYPASAQLHNLKGIASSRSGEHAQAVEDFTAGLQATGSPLGTFENNLAWSALYRLHHLDGRQKVQEMRRLRHLYEVSFDKALTCERVHTAMFVEYEITEVARNQGWYGLMLDATKRFENHFATYEQCVDRVHSGDRYVVEEVAAAAVIAGEMKRPEAAAMSFAARVRAAELQLTVDHQWCADALPVGPVATCFAQFGAGASLMSF